MRARAPYGTPYKLRLSRCAEPSRFDKKGNFVPFLFPGRVIGQTLVRQGRQTEARVGDSDALAFVRQDFRSDVDEQPTLWIDHLAGTFSAMYQDEPMNSLGSIAFFQWHSYLRYCNDDGIEKLLLSTVGLSDGAI